jgi:starch phosphorylase
VINNDATVGDRLRLLFLPDYSVSEAQLIVPAADLSEQISTAGTEASGTGNMKLALNGALTIGTLDGANIEIAEAVGRDNFFAFGLTIEGAAALRARGHDPRAAYQRNGELRRAIDMIAGGAFSPDAPDRFRAIVDSLLEWDGFLLLADFEDYLARQADVEVLYRDPEAWSRRAILNVAHMGRMSSDRAVAEYAARIWNVPVERARTVEPAY